MIFHFLEISSDKSEAFLKVGVVSQAILHFHNLQQFICTHKKITSLSPFLLFVDVSGAGLLKDALKMLLVKQ